MNLVKHWSLLYSAGQKISATDISAGTALLTETLGVLCGLNMEVLTPNSSMADFAHLDTDSHET